MTGWELALLYIAWLIGGGSSGPATLALASTGMARGRKAALALAMGILVGSGAWAIAAAGGGQDEQWAAVWCRQPKGAPCALEGVGVAAVPSGRRWRGPAGAGEASVRGRVAVLDCRHSSWNGFAVSKNTNSIF